MDETARCTANGCPAPRYREEWCALHWRNLTNFRSPEPTPEERFWAKVRKDGPLIAARPDLGPCWPYTGYLTKGYGRLDVVRGKRIQAHRFAYEQLRGEAPVGKIADHLCHTLDPDCEGGEDCPHRACCNPDHLEFITVGENVLRGKGLSAANARKTECAQGHPFDDTNTWVNPKNGARQCKMCSKLRTQARYWKRKLDASS